jgi:hypothetical protein
MNGSYKQYKIYKYKWNDKLSIDFLIDNIITVNDTLKTATVYVSTKTTNIPFNTKIQLPSQLTTNFNSSVLHIYKYVNNNVNPFYDILNSKDIVECVWDKTLNVWMPYKIRYDKIIPNYIDIAEDVFEDILYPPDILQITANTNVNNKNIAVNNNNCLDNFNKCSNLEKRKLIEKYASGIGLDLGIGKLGDLHKYNNNNKITKIWGLEPDDFNRTEALNRLKSKKHLNVDFQILPYKAQDTQNIFKKVSDKLNFIASFFSLTFFYENELILNNFCETINYNLVDGGYFIGTTMDGKATYDLLYNKDNINIDNCYNITKNYNDNVKGAIGQNIYIRLIDTIVDQSEWLAWFDILVNKLKSFNISLVDTYYFNSNDYSELSNPEKILFNCYRSFVFKKNTTNATNKNNTTTTTTTTNTTTTTTTIVKKLRTLPTNKVEIFDNKFTKEVLVRIGTIGDGSCFFHSVLYLIDSRYRSMNDSDKKDLIKIIRDMFSESLSRKTWKSFGNGILALTSYQINLNNYLANKKYKFINLNINSNNVDEYISKLKDSLNKYPDNLSNDIIEKLNNIFDKILENTYQEYLQNIKDTDVWVGDNVEDSINIFQYVSDIFNINIFIIKDSTKLPYLSASDCNIMYKNRPSILLLNINNVHFESIALANSNNIQDLQYILNFDNPLITKIMDIINCKN